VRCAVGCGAAMSLAGVLFGVAGCGSPGTPSSGPSAAVTPVRPACQDGAVALVVGDELDLARCGPDASAGLASGRALRATGPLSFTAIAAGGAVVEVSSGPSCAPGAVCSQLRVQRARLRVTVR
jgi:hypothetical protein